MLHLFASALHSGLRLGDEASVSPASTSETQQWKGDEQMLLFVFLLDKEEAARERAQAALHRDGAHHLVHHMQPAREHL